MLPLFLAIQHAAQCKYATSEYLRNGGDGGRLVGAALLRTVEQDVGVE